MKTETKKLLLLRHGKPEPSHSDTPDLARDLLDEGLKSSVATGRTLEKLRIIPDIVLTSPAIRARKTAHLAASHSGFGGEVLQIQSLYRASSREIFAMLHHLENIQPEPGRDATEAEAIMIVGHNPAIEELVSAIEGKLEPVHAGDLVIVDLGVDDWKQAEITSATVDRIIRAET